VNEGVAREGTIPFGKYHTWYRIEGPLDSALTPIVTLHGGPGFSHDHIEAVGALSRTGHPVIFYDQLGNGRSTQLSDQPESFWTVELFKDEFFNLVSYLGIEENFIIFGHSWGTMLGSEIAVTQPIGLRALILSSGLASSAKWASEASRLIEELPVELREAIRKAINSGDFDSPEFTAANNYYLSLHGSRLKTHSPGLQRSMEYLTTNPSIYLSMWGAAEFVVKGSLREWSVVERLHRIQVPTLVVSGFYDQATPQVQEEFVQNIQNVQSEVFSKSSHAPFDEEPEAYIASVSNFLSSLTR
jgi:L-proline amide hydrolase